MERNANEVNPKDIFACLRNMMLHNNGEFPILPQLNLRDIIALLKELEFTVICRELIEFEERYIITPTTTGTFTLEQDRDALQAMMTKLNQFSWVKQINILTKERLAPGTICETLYVLAFITWLNRFLGSSNAAIDTTEFILANPNPEKLTPPIRTFRTHTAAKNRNGAEALGLSLALPLNCTPVITIFEIQLNGSGPTILPLNFAYSG
jgi:hypothetical protein